jgi:hypothetical protein
MFFNIPLTGSLNPPRLADSGSGAQSKTDSLLAVKPRPAGAGLPLLIYTDLLQCGGTSFPFIGP